jgi:hypothetical protein
MTAPDRTYAVVVGIERYEAGDAWDLDGSAESALRIISWLRRCHVPAENITALLSPLETNRSKVKQALAELEFLTDPLPATVDEIRRVITEQLPAKDGDLLVLFWSGHGVLDQRKDRRLFCANAAVNAKYNINVTDLLAALSGANFRGLRQQVIIVDACANFIQEMRLRLPEPESEFAVGNTRPVTQDALLAAAQGEKAQLDQKASSGMFAQIVADWLDEHAPTPPPPMDQLAKAVVAGFERLRERGVTAQHPVRIKEILHTSGTEGTDHVFGEDPVPENAWRAARTTGLTTGQLRRIAEAIKKAPQLADQHGREALTTELRERGVVGDVPRTDDSDADLLDLVSAVLERKAPAVLFEALLDLATNEEERIAAVAVRRRWKLQADVKPLLGMLRGIPLIHVWEALAQTVCDVPADPTDLDKALELLKDLPASGSTTPPLVEFLVRLQQRRPDLEIPIPAGWFAEQGLDEAAVAALRTRVAGDWGKSRKLVIDLSRSAPGAWQAAVTGYLGPRWCTRTVKCEPEVNALRGAVVKIVQWARSHAANLTIGFMLGHDLLRELRELPEQWEYEDTAIAPIPLCLQHPVVLHAAERMTVPQLRPVWDSKLAAIEASAHAPPSVLWLDRDDARAIRRAVQASEDAYVALAFVPETRPDPRNEAVMAAVAAGAPYVLWVQTAPAEDYDLRECLTKLLGPISKFPTTLPERREADAYLSGALRVIWDRQEELPPYLERLGEELMLNG